MPDNLTYRQAQFATQYVVHKGHGTKAAIAAGYAPSSAHVRASELVRQRKIQKRIEKLTRRHEISAERVLTRLDNLSLKAEEEGNFAASVRAEELIGKSLGMWVDRSVSVNLDLTGEHVAAIRALASRRQSKSGRAGDDALEVQTTAEIAGDKGICHNVGYAISDPDNQAKSVIDQRTSPDVLTPSTLKQSSDVDE